MSMTIVLELNLDQHFVALRNLYGVSLSTQQYSVIPIGAVGN